MSSIPPFSLQNTRRLEEVVTLHPHDVVFGCYRYHSGNNSYREMILRYRAMHNNSSPEDIAMKIVQSVYQQLPSGRFLSFSLQSNRCVVLTNEQAVRETINVFLQGSLNLQVPSNSRQRDNYHDNTCSCPSPMEIYHYELEQQGLSQQLRCYHSQQQQQQQQQHYPLPPRLQPPWHQSRQLHPNQFQQQQYHCPKPVQQLHQSLQLRHNQHQQHNHDSRHCPKPEQQLQDQHQFLPKHRGHKHKKVTKASRKKENSEDAASIIVIDLSTEDDDVGGNEKDDGDTQKGSHEGQKLDDGRKVKNIENMGNTVERSSDKSVINLLGDSEDEEDGGKTHDDCYQENPTPDNDISKNQVLQCTSVEHINTTEINNDDRMKMKEKKAVVSKNNYSSIDKTDISAVASPIIIITTVNDDESLSSSSSSNYKQHVTTFNSNNNNSMHNSVPFIVSNLISSIEISTTTATETAIQGQGQEIITVACTDISSPEEPQQQHNSAAIDDKVAIQPLPPPTTASTTATKINTATATANISLESITSKAHGQAQAQIVPHLQRSPPPPPPPPPTTTTTTKATVVGSGLSLHRHHRGEDQVQHQQQQQPKLQIQPPQQTKCRNTEDIDTLFDIVFNKKQLGLVLGERKIDGEVKIIVTKVTNEEHKKNIICSGDILFSVGNIQLTKNNTIKTVMDAAKIIASFTKRPLTLRFSRTVIIIDESIYFSRKKPQQQAWIRSVMMEKMVSSKNKKRIGIRESKDNDLTFDDEEDDVVIVEKVDRFVECQTKDDNDRKYNQDNDDVDVRIIGSTGSNALADFAHSREDCVTNPFSKDPKVYCPKCYCYVCDIKASDCTKWDSHFQAKRSEIRWRSHRSKVRSKRKAPEREMQRLGAHLLASTADKLPTKRSRRKLHQNI